MCSHPRLLKGEAERRPGRRDKQTHTPAELYMNTTALHVHASPQATVRTL